MVSNPLTDPEWADRTVDFIDRVVSTVRRYTTQCRCQPRCIRVDFVFHP
jgi:hypothetical protein